MALDIFSEKGMPLDRQRFTWREMVQTPISKLDDDAFTRVRIILMNGIEMESVGFQHDFARMSRDMRGHLARVRRVEAHQQAMVNWLLPPDQSPLETTIGYEQVAIEITAAVAQQEPDPYLAQVYRFGMLEASTTSTATPRCSTGSRARMPTTSCRATPTSARAAPRSTRTARRRTTCAGPMIAPAPPASPSSTP